MAGARIQYPAGALVLAAGPKVSVRAGALPRIDAASAAVVAEGRDVGGAQSQELLCFDSLATVVHGTAARRATVGSFLRPCLPEGGGDNGSGAHDGDVRLRGKALRGGVAPPAVLGAQALSTLDMLGTIWAFLGSRDGPLVLALRVVVLAAARAVAPVAVRAALAGGAAAASGVRLAVILACDCAEGDAAAVLDIALTVDVTEVHGALRGAPVPHLYALHIVVDERVLDVEAVVERGHLAEHHPIRAALVPDPRDRAHPQVRVEHVAVVPRLQRILGLDVAKRVIGAVHVILGSRVGEI
mmetsp:Transcript_1108/g.4487  ORF Transcript_1108/g.4487 Transcript_1108/m.4487 type:complete len:299 (+) Transcript_1108:4533-5429(+)